MDTREPNADLPPEDWSDLLDDAEPADQAAEAPEQASPALQPESASYDEPELDETPELDDGPSMQLITFSLGDALFALDILRVQEIIRMAPITPVPHTPSYVDGVLTLRGKIVPVVDLRTRVGMPRESQQFGTRVVVTSVRSSLLGLVVDRVHEVARLPLSRLESATTHSAVGDYVQGVGTLRKRLVTLLDLDAIGKPIGTLAA
ncbi:MAG: chemotaxis protein CheW [Nitrospirota bacterium]|nr:chemotaxis protein CheW [Nitrospirota bacterium]